MSDLDEFSYIMDAQIPYLIAAYARYAKAKEDLYTLGRKIQQSEQFTQEWDELCREYNMKNDFRLAFEMGRAVQKYGNENDFPHIA